MVCCFFIGNIVVRVSLFIFPVTDGVFVSSKVWVGLVTPLGFKPRTFRTGI